MSRLIFGLIETKKKNQIVHSLRGICNVLVLLNLNVFLFRFVYFYEKKKENRVHDDYC